MTAMFDGPVRASGFCSQTLVDSSLYVSEKQTACNEFLNLVIKYLSTEMKLRSTKLILNN